MSVADESELSGLPGSLPTGRVPPYKRPLVSLGRLRSTTSSKVGSVSTKERSPKYHRLFSHHLYHKPGTRGKT